MRPATGGLPGTGPYLHPAARPPHTAADCMCAGPRIPLLRGVLQTGMNRMNGCSSRTSGHHGHNVPVMMIDLNIHISFGNDKQSNACRRLHSVQCSLLPGARDIGFDPERTNGRTNEALACAFANRFTWLNNKCTLRLTIRTLPRYFLSPKNTVHSRIFRYLGTCKYPTSPRC